jgi:hypothetical protein
MTPTAYANGNTEDRKIAFVSLDGAATATYGDGIRMARFTTDSRVLRETCAVEQQKLLVIEFGHIGRTGR